MVLPRVARGRDSHSSRQVIPAGPAISFGLCKTSCETGPGTAGAEQGGRKDCGFGLRRPEVLSSAAYRQVPSPARTLRVHPSPPCCVRGASAASWGLAKGGRQGEMRGSGVLGSFSSEPLLPGAASPALPPCSGHFSASIFAPLTPGLVVASRCYWPRDTPPLPVRFLILAHTFVNSGLIKLYSDDPTEYVLCFLPEPLNLLICKTGMVQYSRRITVHT